MIRAVNLTGTESYVDSIISLPDEIRDEWIRGMAPETVSKE